MSNRELMRRVRRQLAVDYNCEPEDFLREGFVFAPAAAREGRRPFPWVEPRLEMVTMGFGVVVNASSELMPDLRRALAGKSRYEAMAMPFVGSVNPYYLPDAERAEEDGGENGESAAGVVVDVLEREEILALYEWPDFPYALQYDAASLHPERTAVTAWRGGELVGIASALGECRDLWQVCVDVLPSCRGEGIAPMLVRRLTREVLARGAIPYYTTDVSHVASQRVAVKAGYRPAWAHSFRPRLEFLRRAGGGEHRDNG